MASLHRSGLKEKALSLLARKPQSRKELERKLSQWEATQEEAAAICERMAELGYLDDAAYAAQVVRYYSAKGYGERKRRDELYCRGVPRELWEDALDQAQDSSTAIDAFLTKKLGGRTPDRQELKKLSDALAPPGLPLERDQRGPGALRGGGGAGLAAAVLQHGEHQLGPGLKAVPVALELRAGEDQPKLPQELLVELLAHSRSDALQLLLQAGRYVLKGVDRGIPPGFRPGRARRYNRT